MPRARATTTPAQSPQDRTAQGMMRLEYAGRWVAVEVLGEDGVRAQEGDQGDGSGRPAGPVRCGVDADDAGREQVSGGEDVGVYGH